MEKDRLKLDCSARFYPIMATKKYQSLYRISVIMGRDVKKDDLEFAANVATKNFPAFAVRIKRGYAWHYLVQNDEKVKIFEADGKLLNPIDFKLTGGYPFRISYEKNKIFLDMFHALTDGTGALEFLKNLLQVYNLRVESELGEEERAKFESALNVTPEICLEEVEDAFERYSERIPLFKLNIKGMAGKAPHRISGTLLKEGLKGFCYEAKTSEVLSRAKARDASFTAYILGAIGCAIKNHDKPVVIMVPINLRNIFKSKTKRNFTMFARVSLKSGKYSLQDYVDEAKRQLASGVKKESLKDQIATTVKGMNNFLMNATPLFLKTFFAKVGRLFMRSRQTVIFSNLGNVEFEGLGVKEVAVNLNVSKNNVQNVAAISFEGVTKFMFTSAIAEERFPDEFKHTLEEDGIELTPRKI